jgi:hypothetical protein
MFDQTFGVISMDGKKQTLKVTSTQNQRKRCGINLGAEMNP